MPATCETVSGRQHFLQMNGKEVYKFATRVVTHSAKRVLDRCGYRVVDTRYMSSGDVEVDVEVPLTGIFADAVLPSSFGGGTFLAAGGGAVCPTCGQPMVRRSARNGPKAGQPFWGCSAYPRCRGTQPLEKPSDPSDGSDKSD